MAGDGIDVDLDDLRTVTERLGQFKSEFENIGNTTDGVEEAVGRPVGDGRLRDKVDSFQAGWDGNREVVQESLNNVHTHLVDFIDQIEQLDRELATGGEQ